MNKFGHVKVESKNMRFWIWAIVFCGMLSVEGGQAGLSPSRTFLKVVDSSGKAVSGAEVAITQKDHPVTLENGRLANVKEGYLFKTGADGEFSYLAPKDAYRLFEMYIGAFDQASAWSEEGVIGVHRFLQRVWGFMARVNKNAPMDEDNRRLVHKTIKDVGD